VRLSTALIDVICLKRGTTFSTVLSMLLMRHERQSSVATGVFEESGRPRRQPSRCFLEGLWSAEPKALRLAPAKSASGTVTDRIRVGGDAVVIASEKPGRSRYLSVVEAGTPRLREHRWPLGPFPRPHEGSDSGRSPEGDRNDESFRLTWDEGKHGWKSGNLRTTVTRVDSVGCGDALTDSDWPDAGKVQPLEEGKGILRISRQRLLSSSRITSKGRAGDNAAFSRRPSPGRSAPTPLNASST
jgi:hypothetical protein